MHKFTENAVAIMKRNGHSLVFCNRDTVCSSDVKGVRSLVTLVLNKESMKGFWCADKVVGRAAAFMYVFLKPEELYAGVLSEKAKEVLDRFQVRCFYGELVEAIINRSGDGFCPMESATEKAESPEEALTILKEKLDFKEKLSKGKTVTVPVIKKDS